MASRLGITTDLEVAKWELSQQFKNTRNWRSTPPFEDQKTALEWVNKKSEELKCKTVGAIKGPKTNKIRWFGFVFEHDGPR